MKEREILRQAEHRFGREKEVMLVEQRNQNLLLSNLKTIQVWHYTNDIYSPVGKKVISVFQYYHTHSNLWPITHNRWVKMVLLVWEEAVRTPKSGRQKQNYIFSPGISSNKNRFLHGTMKWNNWKHYTTMPPSLNIQTKMWLKSRTSLKCKDILNGLIFIANSFTNLPFLCICKNNDLIYI